MGGIMPERKRNSAWDALKTACQRYIEIEESIDISMNEDERAEAENALSNARAKIIDIWDRFPECWGDHPSTIPPAMAILASIKRQEEAEAAAERLRA